MMEERYREALSRHAEKQINNRLISAYQKAQKDILKQISKIFERVAREGSWSWIEMNKFNRAEKLFGETRSILKDLGNTQENSLKQILMDVTREEYARKNIELYFAHKQLKKEDWETIKKSFDLEDYEESYYEILKDDPNRLKGIMFNSIPDKTVETMIAFPWSGANFSERIWKETNRLSQVLKEELAQSMIQGESMYKAAQHIMQ